MWSQSWSNVAEFGTPYPNTATEDITKYLIEQVKKYSYFIFRSSIIFTIFNQRISLFDRITHP